MNKQKGFTLIELLVVIAIIGILASVVLAALSSARSKGQDAAIQSQLSSMRSQAELYYSTTGNNTYGTASANCTGGIFASGTNTLYTLHNSITNKDCGSTTTAWSVAAAGVTSGTFYCVDSTGVSRTYTSTTSPAATTLLGATGTGVHAAAGSTACN